MRRLGLSARFACLLLIASFPSKQVHAQPHILSGSVSIDASAPIATFRGSEAFGVAADGGAREEARPLFLASNQRALRQLAAYRMSYRLRTELGIEAWHWSANGSWSDAAHAQGYWTGAAPAAPEQVSYGYRLPRRGDTNDEANNDGYSRIDDGDPATFWKSNPYLDGRYTGVPGDHQDWVVVELPRAAPIDAIRLRWALPYARRFRVQYWVGEDEYDGRWHDFPHGAEIDGHGGIATIRLSAEPVRARFVRVLLERSSHSASAGSADPRDSLGYALAELNLGRIEPDGRFLDLVRHAASHGGQTVIHVSSTDPWHRATDRDPDTVQPSLLEMRRQGLVGERPLMVPAGVLYDTPDNMLAMLAYLRGAGLRIGKVELGEEPDGQLVAAEDYGALYVEFAARLRRAMPDLAVGGPSLVNGISDTWLTESDDQSWTSHFVKYLEARHALGLLGFFSFEYFPFDNVCGHASIKLREQSRMMADLFQRLRADGVPHTVPWLITEYGYSAFGGEPLVQMPSALLDADVVADFLGRGGKAAFLYGAVPSWPIAGEKRCAGKGNLMLWEADKSGRARWPMPDFYAYRLITQAWADQGDQPNRLYRAETNLRDGQGRPLVTAYPLQRPDGRWSTMLVNRTRRPIALSFHFSSALQIGHGALEIWQYSEHQYCWRHVSAFTRPSRDREPVRFRIVGWDRRTMLPPMSLTVVTETTAHNTPDMLLADTSASGFVKTLAERQHSDAAINEKPLAEAPLLHWSSASQPDRNARR